MSKPILGQEAIVPGYGVGRVTSIGPVSGCGGSSLPDWIGVTPYVAGHEMKFDPINVKLVAILTPHPQLSGEEE